MSYCLRFIWDEFIASRSAEFDGFEVNVDIAKSFEAGHEKIEQSERSLKYDIILLDIQLFPAHLKELRSGEDLGILARKVAPSS